MEKWTWWRKREGEGKRQRAIWRWSEGRGRGRSGRGPQGDREGERGEESIRVLAREVWQNIKNSWKKNILNINPPVHISSYILYWIPLEINESIQKEMVLLCIWKWSQILPNSRYHLSYISKCCFEGLRLRKIEYAAFLWILQAYGHTLFILKEGFRIRSDIERIHKKSRIRIYLMTIFKEIVSFSIFGRSSVIIYIYFPKTLKILVLKPDPVPEKFEKPDPDSRPFLKGSKECYGLTEIRTGFQLVE